MKRAALMVATVLALAALAGAAVCDPAAAAVDVHNAGKNIGDTLRAWAVALFAGGSALGAVYFLLSRKLGPAVAFFGLAMLVGGFVFAPSLMGDLSEGLWKTALE